MNVTTRRFILILAVNALLLLMTKLFLFDIIIVRGRSMEPSLGEGAPVLINKTAFGLTEPFSGAYLLRWREPARGDVVVFRSPLDGLPTVKRCVAVGGDGLTVTPGRLEVNGREYPLKFFQEHLLEQYERVPAGSVLVLGDNTAHSTDSRSFGFIPLTSITGAVWCAPAPPEAGP